MTRSDVDGAIVGSPLSVPIFRALWIASIFSNFGGLIQSVGAAWMMTALGGSAQQVALVQAATTLPIFLFALWAGAVADNLDRRRVMIVAQLVMFTLSVLLSALTWLDLMSPLLLLSLTFLIACGTAINGPAWQASVGDMVPRALVPQAVSYNAMGFNVARSVGPAVGGVLVAAFGAAAAFAVNAASYVGLVTVLTRWRSDARASSLPRERLGDAMWAGVRYVAMSPHIRVVLARASLFGLGASAIPALLPIVARDLIGGGALTYGLLFGAFGLGAIGGAAATARMRRHLSTEALVELSSGALALSAVVAAASRMFWFTAPALGLAGAGWVVALSTFNVGVQLSSPRWVVARTLALYQMATFGGMAAGSWLAGALTQHVTVSTGLEVASAILAFGIVAGRVLRLPRTSSIALDPLDRWQEPDTVLPIQSRSGPIAISVEHSIREEDTPRFLELMAERRRIRLRDGARHWHLLRDLASPTQWIERFDFPTWLDYVRHNTRRTVADADNLDALEDLRVGGGAPTVRRLIERPPSAPAPPPEAMALAAREPLTDPTRAA